MIDYDIRNEYYAISYMYKCPEQFKFIIDNREFIVPKNHAILFSQTAKDLVIADNSVNELKVDANVKHDQTFQVFDHYIKTGTILVNIPFIVGAELYYIGECIKNKELIEVFNSYLASNPICTNNFAGYYEFYTNTNQKSKIFDYFASSFPHIAFKNILQVFENEGIEFAKNVLQDKRIQQFGGNSIISVIVKLIEHDIKYLDLLQFVDAGSINLHFRKTLFQHYQKLVDEGKAHPILLLFHNYIFENAGPERKYIYK